MPLPVHLEPQAKAFAEATANALRDARQVHRDLEGRKTTGSVVMLP
jgi:hypothetical protein